MANQQSLEEYEEEEWETEEQRKERELQEFLAGLAQPRSVDEEERQLRDSLSKVNGGRGSLPFLGAFLKK